MTILKCIPLLQEIQEEPEEENPSKLASIRKAFETRSISVDEKIVERRREEVRQEQTIQEEEKENVGVCRLESWYRFFSKFDIIALCKCLLGTVFFNWLILNLFSGRNLLRYVRVAVSVQQSVDEPLNKEWRVWRRSLHRQPQGDQQLHDLSVSFT